jgi:hypothetical protein
MTGKKYPGGPGRRSEPIEKMGPLDVHELKRQIRGCERRLNVDVRPRTPTMSALRRIIAGKLV